MTVRRKKLWLSVKESACNSEDPGGTGLTPGSRTSLGEGNGNPTYSILVGVGVRGEDGGFQRVICN